MVPPTTRQDSIDRFIEASLVLFPGVDPETEGVIDRFHKIAKHAKRITEATVKRFGFNSGEFHTLLKLRVAPNHQLTAGDLAEHLDLSTGAMTNRLDGLEELGLVTRERAVCWSRPMQPLSRRRTSSSAPDSPRSSASPSSRTFRLAW